MLNKAAILPVACSLMLGACATMGKTDKTPTIAQATLADAAGAPVGNARIEQSGTALSLVAEVRGMSPGQHGIHLHTTGKCEAPGFTSAGGHLNPTAHQHGSMNPAGPHLGDLPNIMVAADGMGEVRAPLTGGAADLLANLLDADGTAVVVHAGPDDYKTDPSGNSGGRIACGVLSRAG
ncbi:superoxide dismutase family protein [Novosphingobium jiangmenense]|uniref:Superoxide dismutase family protein n=1 Tax=Novosphingobium jiangmenense TaxID=2791981 RepID=A0ABS0HDX2_9SPHN|nr:superoxide dismutase family protein [Novosphingobium jiangmenense]MBF9150432.1 superoxide dismutase family protein [Novosphingobium jiangmenense]